MYNSGGFIKALFLSNNSLKFRATELRDDRLALGLGGVLGHTHRTFRALPPGPLGALLLSGVALGNILALLILDIVALNNIILNIVLMEPGGANTLGNLLAALASLLIGQRGVAFPNFLLSSNLLVLNEAVLPEVFIAFFLLLWLKIGGVCGVALCRVAMLALNVIIILRFLLHDHLFDTALASGSNGTNTQIFAITESLAARAISKAVSLPCRSLIIAVVGMVVSMVSVVVASSDAGQGAPLVERECVHERLPISPLVVLGSRRCDCYEQEAQLK